MFHFLFRIQPIHWTNVYNSQQYMWTTTLYYAWCMHICCTLYVVRCTLTISIAKWLFSYVWCLQCEHVHFECICLCRCYFVRAIVVTFILLFLANLYHSPECRLEFSIHLYIIIICYMNIVCALDVIRSSYTHYTLHASYFIMH